MGIFFELGKAKAAKGDGWVRLSSAVPNIQWDSNPNCPYGDKAMGNLNFFTQTVYHIPTQMALF